VHHFDWSLNCGFESLDHLLRFRDGKDTLRPMLQPLGFGFEVELGTRDWWFGGYSNIHYQEPRFNQGLTARWIPLDPADFPDHVRARKARGLATIFQTEWTFVEYISHFGWNLGSLHAAIAFDAGPDGFQVRDRMHNNHPWFTEDGYGTVPARVYRSAFDRRLTVLDYELSEPADTWESEFRAVLEVSAAEMSGGPGFPDHGPHLHLAGGLAGIEYAIDTFAHFAPRYSADSQVRMLLGIRLVDCIRTLMGDRLRLLKAARQLQPDDGSGQPGAEFLRALTEAGRHWRRARKAFAAAGAADSPQLDLAADALRAVLPYERAAADAAAAWAKEFHHQLDTKGEPA
jgi:hypothetical protein